MTDTKRLAKELIGLDETDWYLVLREAETKRRERAMAVPIPDPGPNSSDSEVANWIAQSYLAFDPKTREVIYLPKKAPPREIRLVSVNVLGTVPDLGRWEPYESVEDIEGTVYQVLTVDAPVEQWEDTKMRAKRLPKGWDFKESVVIRRMKPK